MKSQVMLGWMTTDVRQTMAELPRSWADTKVTTKAANSHHLAGPILERLEQIRHCTSTRAIKWFPTERLIAAQQLRKEYNVFKKQNEASYNACLDHF